MKYYLKQGLFPFIYIVFMIITSVSILSIHDLVWLKAILAVLNVGLFGLIAALMAFQEGENSVKVQMANDAERREIIRTGEDRPLKLHEEYKAWKGFLFGFISCCPLVILLLLHTLLYLVAGITVFGTISAVIYVMFFAFFRLGVSADSGATLPWYTYYGTLIALPIVMTIMGVAYILGAKKIERQQEMIKAKQREIYGDKI